MKSIEIEEQNIQKNIKKVSQLVNIAKGYKRTSNSFASDCNIDADYMASIINGTVKVLPNRTFLKVVSSNSEENRVSYKDLLLACGYSLYQENDIESIKNAYIKRGWFSYVDFGDSSIDSEYGGKRLCLVIQNDKGNTFSSTTIVIPLTSRRSKAKLPTHVEIDARYGIPQDSIASCEQIRCVSKRRLMSNGVIPKIADCPDYIMDKIAVARMKADGIIGLHVSEEKAIEMLDNLNNQREYSYNYNNVSNTVPVFSM